MGNVNGNPSEQHQEEEEEAVAATVSLNGGDGIIDNNNSMMMMMMMTHSPPTSPRATHSPLIFTPQVPAVPLQRPDEMHPPIHHSSSAYEHISTQHTIPTMITWTYGAKLISVQGSWDNWKSRTPLQRSGKDFAIMKVLPSGVYQYRFIVDERFTYDPELPWSKDEAGNFYNILDLKDYVPEDIGSISGFEPPQSPTSSYDNVQPSSEDYAKEPPLVPPHFAMTLLNVPTTNMEIEPPMPRPQHGVLNHLYMQKEKSSTSSTSSKSSPSVVALGTTHRYQAKYVTVVLYKPLQKKS
ncbi:SNF1-related protein kinase regulatory subunit beta-2 [Trifolium repens]|nr:SNF1-related protein kinase regulatory subunit beta-2 [Trifolium repens]